METQNSIKYFNDVYSRTGKRRLQLVTSLQFQRSLKVNDIRGTAINFYSLWKGRMLIIMGGLYRSPLDMLNVNNGQLLFTINVEELFKATCRTLLGSTADLAQTKAFVTLELELFISCTAVCKSVNITTLNQNFLSQTNFKSGEYISRDNGASWR